MTDPKKIMVKVPKKVDPEKKEKKEGIVDKESAAENKIELTKQYVDAKAGMAKNLDSDKGKSYTEKAQGIKINSDNMAAKPTMFKRKVITRGGDDGTTTILSSDGKSVKYEGRSNMDATKKALKENDSQTKSTNNSRNSNSNFYNVNSGAKKELDNKDKKTLVDLHKAVKK
jgi:hypothetical protein